MIRWNTSLLALFLTVLIQLHQTEGCSVTQFSCENKKCIPAKWACDEDDDCGDNSDELDCPAVTCSANEFQCDNLKCIPDRWQCDGDDDCLDGSDEKNATCSTNLCADDEFQCELGGQCIPMSWKCDGQEDCKSGDDERQCEAVTCSPDEYKCKSNNRCITNRWRCDRDSDCEDGSDEEDCAEPTCPPENFRCNDTARCIPNRWHCDGDVDCRDGSDEHECPERPAVGGQCHKTEFTCHNFDCIHMSWRCDGDTDCADGSDELACGELVCDDNKFKCGNKKCIPGALQCDGNDDCGDNSDEQECAVTVHSCDTETEFDCSGNGRHCIPIEKLCDGNNDCGAFQDEPSGNNSFCKSPNPCDDNNGGCLHTCHFVQYSQEQHCGCHAGYELDDDKLTCVDVDECAVAGTCSQLCTNVKGSYKCACHEGYILDPKGHYCRASGDVPYLLFANRRDVREIRLDSGEYRTVVAQTRSALAVDFDYEGGYVYWSDVAQEKILRAPYTSGAQADNADDLKEEVVDERLTTPDGLAVDWVHKNLYWTDTGRNAIEVMNIDTKYRKTLFNTDLDEPRAIMVDPRAEHGWMYWSDWGEKAKIERAGMDGNHREVIIDSADLKWPNGLTIDYVINRLFWVDAKLHTIMSSSLDGSDINVVLTSLSYLRHPFSISVFEDTLYWTDWQTESIHKTNKFDGEKVENVAISLFSPMDIHVFHKLKQPNTTSACGSNNGGCSHLCLPAPRLTATSAKLTCACPDHMLLESDSKTCKAIATTTTTTTAAATEAPAVSVQPEDHKGENAKATETEQDVGKIAAIVAASIVGLALIAFVIGFIIYRAIMKRNVQSMNFDNPVYRKTTEDQFSLEKNQYQPSRLPSTLEPLTAGQHETV